MFSEIDSRLAVASAYDVVPLGWQRLDVRGLIDGAGNSTTLIDEYVYRGVRVLQDSEAKLVVVCDYGQSRSNFIAARIYAQVFNVSFTDAVSTIKKSHRDSKIQPSLLTETVPVLRNAASVRNIAVTGGAGFLGSRLCRMLTEKGINCSALSRTDVGDYMTSSIKLKEVLSNRSPDLLVHLAHPKPYNSELSSQLAFSQLVSVVNYCEDNCVPLLFPSSWVVFDGGGAAEVTRSSCPIPHTRYGRLKAACESFLMAASRRSLNLRIIRLPGVFGFDSLDPRFLRYFAECIVSSTPMIYHEFENGSARVPLVPVDDCVSSLVESILRFEELPLIAHLGTQTPTPCVAEIAWGLQELTSVQAVATAVKRQAFVGRFTADVIVAEPAPISHQIQEFVLKLCRASNDTTH